ncbi:MAG: hypothetical protein AAGB46_11080 [Verrucomicrobiota bacterium]
MESLLNTGQRRLVVSELSVERRERYLVMLYDQAIWCDLRDGITANALYNQLERIEHEQLGKIVCSNLLSNCIQILVEVEAYLGVESLLKRFRALSAPWVEWRRDANLYRLAKEDSVKDFAYYVFMGPYRRGLLDVEERNVFWRAWTDEDLLDFGDAADMESFQGSLKDLMTVESLVAEVIVAV